MSDLRETDVLEIGREAASRLLGPGSVERVSVVARPDSTDDPAYYFMIVADQDPDGREASRRRGALGLAIRDALIERGDETYPYIQVIDRADWGKAVSA